MKRLPLTVTFLLLMAVCVSIAYWIIQFIKPATRPVAAPPQVERASTPLTAAIALFGGRQTTVTTTSNFQLKGIIVAAKESDSVAILSSVGKPSKATKINVEVMPGVSVKEIHPGYVLLSESGSLRRLELQKEVKTPPAPSAVPTFPGIPSNTQ
jgi:general secretion pathway protein C